jgi:hypothetical protein
VLLVREARLDCLQGMLRDADRLPDPEMGESATSAHLVHARGAHP